MYASAVTGIKIMRLNYYFYCIICIVHVHIYSILFALSLTTIRFGLTMVGKKVRDDNKRKNN